MILDKISVKEQLLLDCREPPTHLSTPKSSTKAKKGPYAEGKKLRNNNAICKLNQTVSKV